MAAPQGPFILSLVSEKNENLMPINPEMIGKKIEIAPFVYDQDDVIFYALSVGAGVAEIDFIYEKNLKVLPVQQTLFSRRPFSDPGLADNRK